jgi:hypothetical protein
MSLRSLLTFFKNSNISWRFLQIFLRFLKCNTICTTGLRLVSFFAVNVWLNSVIFYILSVSYIKLILAIILRDFDFLLAIFISSVLKLIEAFPSGQLGQVRSVCHGANDIRSSSDEANNIAIRLADGCFMTLRSDQCKIYVQRIFQWNRLRVTYVLLFVSLLRFMYTLYKLASDK